MIVFKSIVIILTEPSLPENIGATARAMRNMGFSQLRIVSPTGSKQHLSKPARRTSSGAEKILEETQVFNSIDEALADLQIIVGCTARRSKERQPLLNPRGLKESLQTNNPGLLTGIVFGREDRGLENWELDLCHLVVTIPTAPEHSSLNLAQAVLLICYELKRPEQPAPKKNAGPSGQITSEELEGLYQHARQVLLRIGFLNPDNPDRILRVLRRITGRAGLDSREARILRGILRQMDWYANKKKE